LVVQFVKVSISTSAERLNTTKGGLYAYTPIPKNTTGVGAKEIYAFTREIFGQAPGSRVFYQALYYLKFTKTGFIFTHYIIE